MNYKYYERKINDVITKCPIEAGVEILVYNVLDDIVKSKHLSLVDINRIWKNKDPRLTTEAGVPDIAVLSEDFEFGNPDKGKVFGLIEVKATNCSLRETEQIEGQKKSTVHHIYTNGLVWVIYDQNENRQETIYLTETNCKCVQKARTISICEDKFLRLLEQLNRINWQK